MFFSDDNIKAFPECTAHMRHALAPATLKKQRPKVYDAFLRACGGATKEADKALTWGNFPRVGVAEGMIVIRGTKMCGFNPPDFFNRSNGSVLVSSLRVLPLEHCVWEVDRINNKRRFESTLLHEIVHYVRLQAGLFEMDMSFPNSPEVGQQFEIWAYGFLQCTADELADAQSSIF